MNCLIFYADKPLILKNLSKIETILKNHSFTILSSHLIKYQTPYTKEESQNIRKDLEKTNLVICLGGDGSILAISHLVSEFNIPILPINFGHLGFISEAEAQEGDSILIDFLNDNAIIEERIFLSINHNGTEYKALNEVFVGGNIQHKIGKFGVSIDNQKLGDYQADGMIVATPTGSTAYSLSAGGPILAPDLENMLFLPVSPHNLTSRPIVISSSHVIEITMGRPIEQNLIIDGQYKASIKQNEKLSIKKANEKLIIVFSRNRNYYNTLQKKLNWFI